MWVSLTISVCLHSQEVKEDPQGAGKSPEMWLTALAANPVHLLKKDGVLKGTHVSMSAQVEKRRVERGQQGKLPEHMAPRQRRASSWPMSSMGTSAIPTHQKISRSENPWHRPSFIFETAMPITEVPGSLGPYKPTDRVYMSTGCGLLLQTAERMSTLLWAM